MAVNFQGKGYSGEVLEDLLTYASQGNDTFENGLIHIKSGIQYKYSLPLVKVGNIIQDNVATPTSTNGQANTGTGFNQITTVERTLEPSDFMVYLEFNPRDFEKYWRPFQPDGNLVFRELDPKVQATLLRLLMDKKNEYLGNAIWSAVKGGSASAGITVPSGATNLGGDTNGGPMKYWNGVMKRILDNVKPTASDEEKASGQVVIAGNTNLTTGQNVEDALYTMWQKCPKTIRNKKNLKFVVGWDVWDLYDKHLSNKNSKYTENAEINKLRFKGAQIVPIVGVPEHTILLGEFSTDMESNLWMGVDYANDGEVLKVERLQANSELFFFQMRMKVDVNIVRPSELVVWTSYKNT